MSVDTPSPTPARQPSGGIAARAALVLAILALAASTWQWLDSQKQAHELKQVLTDKLSQYGESSRESRLVAKHAEELVTQSSAKIAVLEEKLEASKAQQEALQTLYLELASNRDEWTIAEVEQLLVIASQQLQLAGNVKPALLALQTADGRLQQLDKPQVIQLRKVIQKDILRLQSVPSIDIVSMSLKLSNLAEAASTLPLASARHPRPDAATMPDWNSRPWHRLTQEIWQDIKHLVRVERVDHPEPPLLAPEHAYFLRENLRLRLLSARVALLQRDEATYRNDLQQAENWLKRHFDTHDSATQNALSLLQQLAAGGIVIEIPDVSESLNSISKYKLSLDRSRP